ncbi:MAG: hypothetical protein ABEK50_14290, partial [bacterium]
MVNKKVVCLLSLLILITCLPSAGLTLSLQQDDLVGDNEGASPGQIKRVFSGQVTADETINDTIGFTVEIRVPEDDSIAADFDDFERIRLVHDDEVVDSEPIEPPSGFFTLASDSPPGLTKTNPYDYGIDVIPDSDSVHKREFKANLRLVSAEDKDAEGGETPFITFTNLIESYHFATSNDAIPEVLAAQSESIPLLHLMFAGQNPNNTLFFEDVAFQIRERLGEIIPGGSALDNYGDFNTFKLMRSTEPEFGAGSLETLATIERENMPDSHLPGDATDTYTISFAGQADGWRNGDEDLFKETLDQAHYFVTVSTNQGWDTSTDAPNAQFFGYGDAWDAWLDTGALELTTTVTNDAMGDTLIDITQGPIYNSVKNLSGSTGGAIDEFYGDPDANINNGKGLDYLPDRIFDFIALGPADTSAAEKTTLDAITIEFPSSSPGFVPKNDIRNLTNNMKSGISVWFNEAPFDEQSHADNHLPLSPDRSSWLSDTKVRVELQDGFNLKPPQDSISSPDEDLEVNRGMMDRFHPKTALPTFYVNFLMNQSANHADTFEAQISTGGLHFSQGNSVEQINPVNYTVLDSLLSSQVHSDTTGTLTQAVEVFFSQLVPKDKQIGAPSKPLPVIGLNVQDHSNASGTDVLLDQVDVIFEEGDPSFTAGDLNPLSNTDQSGVAIYRDNNSHPNNNSGQFDPDIDVRMPLDVSKSTKNGPTGEAADDPFARLFIDHSASTPAVVPHDDQGDSEGTDYFVVVRTSDNADNRDEFKATMGNRGVSDGIRPVVEFVESSTPSNSVSEIFSKGDLAASDRFFTRKVQINTITALSINDLTNPAQRITVDAPHLPVFGFNIADGDTGDQTLERVDVTFNFNNTTDSSDIARLGSTEESGIALYRDDGDGEFNRNKDALVQIVDPDWTVYGDTASVDLVPADSQPISDENDQTDDYFIGVRSSRNMEFGDTFTMAIEGKDIIFSVEKSDETDTAVTNTITAGLPIIISDRGSPPTHNLSPDNAPLDVVGINTADTNTGQFLDELTISLEDTGANDFSITDLKEITSDSESGVAVWRDSDGNGEFEPDTDSFIKPTGISEFVNDEFTFTFTGTDDDTSIPDRLDDTDDFLIALRPSSKITKDDDFVLGIPDKGFQTDDNFSNNFEFTSRRIVSTEGNVDNTPPDILTIKEPSDGQSVFEDKSDTLLVKVRAEDNVLDDTTAVGQVTVLLDGVELSPTATQVSTHDWEQVIDLGSLSGGTHTLSAKATDIHGNETGPIDPIEFELIEANDEPVSISKLSQLVDKTIDVEVTVANQSFVELRLAVDENVNDSPANFTVVEKKRPDVPGGSTYTFNDIKVSLSADTAAVVARGFNDAGVTDFSSKLFFNRDEILGVTLTGRLG